MQRSKLFLTKMSLIKSACREPHLLQSYKNPQQKCWYFRLPLQPNCNRFIGSFLALMLFNTLHKIYDGMETSHTKEESTMLNHMELSYCDNWREASEEKYSEDAMEVGNVEKETEAVVGEEVAITSSTSKWWSSR